MDNLCEGLGRFIILLKYDVRDLYYYLHLIQFKAPGAGRNARYYVPIGKKRYAKELLPKLERFRNDDLRPVSYR